MMEILKNSQDLAQLIEQSNEKPVVVFKHSATCPFSARAQEQVANAKHDLEIGAIVVQYAPDLKVEIAEKLDVEHQSPQAIIVYKGKATDYYWREKIKKDTLVERVKELAEG